jgi:hypothetical protein
MGQPDPFPTFATAMMEELDELSWMASFADSLFLTCLTFLNKLLCINVYKGPVKSLLYCFAC